MGRKRKIPKKLVVPTEPMVEEPLKIYHTPEAFYLDHLRSLCARAETPTSLVEGKTLDENACYVRHRISEKGKLLLESMEEEIDETVSSLDEKDDEESEEQKGEERISYPCAPSNDSNSSTHTLFNFPSPTEG